MEIMKIARFVHHETESYGILERGAKIIDLPKASSLLGRSAPSSIDGLISLGSGGEALLEELLSEGLTTGRSGVMIKKEDVILRALSRDPAGRYQHASEFGEALTRFLFSRGLAVSRNDIARLCQDTVNDQEAAAPRVVEQAGGIIDALIQEEILKFTSLDDLEDPLDAGSKPLSPEDISVMTPLDPGDFIDPRGWASDLEEEPPLDVITDRPPQRSPAPQRPAPAASRRSPTPAAASAAEDQERMPVPAHRKPSPAPREEAKSSMPAAVWVLALLALIAVAGVALVLTGIIEI